ARRVDSRGRCRLIARETGARRTMSVYAVAVAEAQSRTAGADHNGQIRAIWQSSRLARLPARCQELLMAEPRERAVVAGEMIRWDEHILALVTEGRICIFMSARGRRAAMRYVSPGEMFGLPTVI